jgi:hypothetical protein
VEKHKKIGGEIWTDEWKWLLNVGNNGHKGLIVLLRLPMCCRVMLMGVGLLLQVARVVVDRPWVAHVIGGDGAEAESPVCWFVLMQPLVQPNEWKPA